MLSSHKPPMIHFAYPNVIPRESKFLGCDRYVAARLAESPGDGYELAEPNISSIAEVHLAALKLAPESVETKLVIYEKQDPSPKPYRGESLDFAYLLSLISRSRQLRVHGTGDLWCTGGIDIKDGDRPFLKAVDGTGFACKLHAFLAHDNPDTIFFAPAQNMDALPLIL